VLNSYLDWFIGYVDSKKDGDIEIINATEGGADIKGSIIMKLEEVIEKYESKNDIEESLNEYFEDAQTFSVEEKYWLSDYGDFRALKSVRGGTFSEWNTPLTEDETNLSRFYQFVQFVALSQKQLSGCCNNFQ
jgi:4-alpha-glucanotransferase